MLIKKALTASFLSFCLLCQAVAAPNLTALQRASFSTPSYRITPSQMIAAGSDTSVGLAEATRGVVIQGKAAFLTPDFERAVPAAQVSLNRTKDGYCLKIEDAPCNLIPLPLDIVEAAIRYASSKGSQAFSLVSDRDDPDRQKLIEESLSSKGLEKIKEEDPDSGRVRYVHSAFSGTAAVEMLEFLDLGFAPFQRASDADQAYLLGLFYAGISAEQREKDMEDAAILSKAGGAADQSYLISDVGSNFIIYNEDDSLRCQGAPFKYHWVQMEGRSTISIARIEELAKDSVEDSADTERARWLFCVVAAAAALQ